MLFPKGFQVSISDPVRVQKVRGAYHSETHVLADVGNDIAVERQNALLAFNDVPTSSLAI